MVREKIYRNIRVFSVVTVLLMASGFSDNQKQPIWLTSYSSAAQMSVETHHPILMIFSGSDWCRPCMRFEMEVLNTVEFENFARDHLVLLKVDFPARKKNQLSTSQQEHNDNLAEKYNPEGNFPFVLLIDSAGKELGQIEYLESGVETFIAAINHKLK